MSLKYIVTGTGRCGTMFMSKFLTSANINCGHELIFNNDGLEKARTNIEIYNDLEADASYMAAPYLSTDLLCNSKIIHIVREPMEVINSFIVAFCYFLSHRPSCKQIEGEWTYEYPPGADPEFKFMKFMYSHIPALHHEVLTPVERAALYYVEWNKMIEEKCKGRDFLFYPIENDISKVCDFIGVKKSLELYCDKNTNKAEYDKRYVLQSVPSGYIRDELINIGKRYGYSMRTPIML